jgi:hypothetical protein
MDCMSYTQRTLRIVRKEVSPLLFGMCYTICRTDTRSNTSFHVIVPVAQSPALIYNWPSVQPPNKPQTRNAVIFERAQPCTASLLDMVKAEAWPWVTGLTAGTAGVAVVLPASPIARRVLSCKSSGVPSRACT